MLIKSSIVKVGNIAIGGENPVCVQSMTSTNTKDTKSSVEQIVRLVDVGCEVVRLTTRDVLEAENLKNIKDELHIRGINIPLIADIHFNPKVAEVAAKYAEKIRINPGNYIDKRLSKQNFTDEEYVNERNKIADRIEPLIEICKQHNTAIRIGSNHGSLSERIMFKYGNTAKGMVESALEFVDVFRNFNFHNIVLSMKASHVPTMIEANRLLVEEMKNRNYYYPLHLGVTEAGDGDDARIKSAAGIACLLAEGIGDTIRVSLTEEPENEIPFAKKLVEKYGQRRKLEMPSFKVEKNKPLKYYLAYNNLSEEDLLIQASVDFTRLNLKNPAKELSIINPTKEENKLSDNILQALGIKYSKAEFIACPSCGRTLFNIIDELEKVRKVTTHLKGLKIAIMGCVVNGIGEMADADYGYVGAGAGKVSIFKKQQLIKKNIPEEIAVDALVELIKANGDWVNNL
jgi:(E)-4-hydroxy-3-methylbut-2-enyl-diphosphate synthase